MKKSHYKKAIDKLFDQWPWHSGFDPEKDIVNLTISPAEGEEGDKDVYAVVQCECWPEDCRYGSPKLVQVTFNLSKKKNEDYE